MVRIQRFADTEGGRRKVTTRGMRGPLDGRHTDGGDHPYRDTDFGSGFQISVIETA